MVHELWHIAKQLDVQHMSVSSVRNEIAPLVVVASERGIIYVSWETTEEILPAAEQFPGNQLSQQHLAQAVSQLEEFFAGQRTAFELSLCMKGTAFQEAVWQALSQLPYGQTVSYAEIANSIGRPKAVRAVGQANKANRIAIVVPCHRVIGANGKMTGYSGNRSEIKERLLQIEGSFLL